MDRDYSWEDQDPEEIQSWHEFQGEISEPKFIDSAAFQFDQSEFVIDEDDSDDEDWDDDSDDEDWDDEDDSDDED